MADFALRQTGPWVVTFTPGLHIGGFTQQALALTMRDTRREIIYEIVEGQLS